MDRYLHHPVLGTNLMVGIQIDGDETNGAVGGNDISSGNNTSTGTELTSAFDELSEHLDRVIVDEIARLEAIFTIFDPRSELERWKRGEDGSPNPEFSTLMGEARRWVVESGGAFHPLSAALNKRWRDAAAVGRPPDPTEIAAIVERLRDPGFDLVDGRPVATGDVSGFQLHALAKGWIVDRAIDRAIEESARWFQAAAADRRGAVDLIVNAGGDLAHRGEHAKVIGIENPLRTYDNEPPLDRVEIRNAGLATSGRARQGFEIDGRWYSHVIDPRTGAPVDHHASITIVAPNAATADVVATIAGVEPVDEALGVANRHRVACLVVTNEGELRSNEAWDRLRHVDPASR